MDKKIMIAILFSIFTVLLVSGCSKQTNSGATNTNSNTENNAATGNTDTAMPSAVKISTEELAKHNLENDCWIAYDGKVYDVTVFLPMHPGGAEKIIKYCGTSDAFQNAFTRKHGLSKVEMLVAQTVYKGEFA